MTATQLSLFSPTLEAPPLSYPSKTKPGAFWYHEKQCWFCYCSGVLEPYEHAGISGFPRRSQLSPGFGRYVALELDGTFNLRKTKDPSYRQEISHLYFGEDGEKPRLTGLW